MKGVIQVLDQEEEIAMQEFAKFEAKLKERKLRIPDYTNMPVDIVLIRMSSEKGPYTTASTVDEGSLDTING